MPRSYIESLCYGLGACTGLMMGLTRESLLLLKSLTSVRGWARLYVGTKPTSRRKIAYGGVQPEPSSACPAGPADTASFLGARPPELVTPTSRGPVYSSSPKFGRSPVQAANVTAMPASQLNGISGQPNFDHPSTSTSSPARPNLQAVSPTPSPAVTSSSATQLSAAAPSFYPASPSTLYAPPAQSATAEPLSAAPFQTPSFVAHPSVPAAPTLMSDALPAVAPEATRSPPSPPTEDFTAADMQSTAEEIGAQPISNAGKIKKLRTRIGSKLKGIKN